LSNFQAAIPAAQVINPMATIHRISRIIISALGTEDRASPFESRALEDLLASLSLNVGRKIASIVYTLRNTVARKRILKAFWWNVGSWM
jgi:hypothetical protein